MIPPLISYLNMKTFTKITLIGLISLISFFDVLGQAETASSPPTPAYDYSGFIKPLLVLCAGLVMIIGLLALSLFFLLLIKNKKYDKA
jgi:Mg2+/Co2+ transporter CorB